MEARLSFDARRRAAVLALLGMAICGAAGARDAAGAGYRTQFFLVTAPTADYAREVGETAERLRKELALQWLGHELPAWRDVCPIEVVPASGAGGVTQFYFDRGQPHGWTMRVQGSRERVLDSVLPHELTHTVFATHFGRPLPRWADEGACTTTEDISERRKQEKLLNAFLRTNRGIPFNRMFEMTEYPSDVLPLYAQGYSLARFLIALEGKPEFIAFVGQGLKTRNWGAAIQKHYGFQDLSDLQVRWNRWVAKGGQEQLAANFRSESPGASTPPVTLVDETVVPQPPASGPQYDALATIPDDPEMGTRLTPLTPVAASNPGTPPKTGSGYYVRRRDEHRAQHPELLNRFEDGSKTVRSRPAGSASAPTNTARPQPPQPAEQVIIEWSRPASPTTWR